MNKNNKVRKCLNPDSITEDQEREFTVGYNSCRPMSLGLKE